MINLRKRFNSKHLALIALIAANLLFFLTIWLANKYDHVSLDQFIYQMKSSAAGANRSLANSAIVRVGLFGMVLTCLEALIYLVCTGRFHKLLRKNPFYIQFRSTKLCRFIARRAMPLVAAILVISMSFFTLKLDIIGYASAIATDSDLIENHYVDPLKAELTFPETKRNLVYIFLESMEVTFSDTEAGGPILDNYTPELAALAQQNINFSHNANVGGALSFAGTTWTAAALVSQTSGVIVQVPLLADDYGGENSYIPGLVSLGEVLEKEGYQQTLLFGSDAAFGGRDSYFSEHGSYEIIDIHALKDQGRLPEDYLEWWGFEDEKLFGFAKEELTRLASCDKPFNFTMLTADTHFPDGYVCRLCGEEYEEQYPNVLRCSSKQIYEFISWIQEQPFYENTTIVISGDHLTMDPDFLEDVDENYVRTVYNCIINAPITPSNEKNRQFGTFDLFPTTLAAMGVTIAGDRLGLGTNLFSDKQTLTELYGFEVLNYEFQKNSDFYNSTFLQMDRKEEE